MSRHGASLRLECLQATQQARRLYRPSCWANVGIPCAARPSPPAVLGFPSAARAAAHHGRSQEPMSDSPFAVIESRWWNSGNHSVRPIFEAVSAIHFGNPSAFFYDMFSEKTSLAATLQARATDTRTEVVYLASHGDENHVGPNAANAVSRTGLRNCFFKSNREGQIKGLFLGTCLTG